MVQFAGFHEQRLHHIGLSRRQGKHVKIGAPARPVRVTKKSERKGKKPYC